MFPLCPQEFSLFLNKLVIISGKLSLFLPVDGFGFAIQGIRDTGSRL